MTLIKRMVGALGVATVATLTGCGSGYVEPAFFGSQVGAFSTFTLDMRINGVFIPEVGVDAGFQQDVPMRAGSSFEILASSPVLWTVTIDGQVVNPPLGTSVVFSGVSIFPNSISATNYSAITGAQGLLSRTRVVSIFATSVVDSRQEARINILLTN